MAKNHADFPKTQKLDAFKIVYYHVSGQVISKSYQPYTLKSLAIESQCSTQNYFQPCSWACKFEMLPGEAKQLTRLWPGGGYYVQPCPGAMRVTLRPVKL